MRIRLDLTRRGLLISEMDMLIAGIAVNARFDEYHKAERVDGLYR